MLSAFAGECHFHLTLLHICFLNMNSHCNKVATRSLNTQRINLKQQYLAIIIVACFKSTFCWKDDGQISSIKTLGQCKVQDSVIEYRRQINAFRRVLLSQCNSKIMSTPERLRLSTRALNIPPPSRQSPWLQPECWHARRRDYRRPLAWTKRCP